MARWVHVNESGVVDFQPNNSLPEEWNGELLAGLTPAELKFRGFLPEAQVGFDTPYDPTTHRKLGPKFTPGPDDVTATWVVRPKTSEELAEDAELEESHVEGVAKGRHGKLHFREVNEIRILKGQPALTGAQFLNFVRNL